MFLIMRRIILCLAIVFLVGASTGSDVDIEKTAKLYESMGNGSFKACKKSEVNGEGIYFHFYTRERILFNATVESFKKGAFPTWYNENKVTKILVHGWHGYSHMGPFEEMVLDYLVTQDVNVISMDWSVYARKCNLQSISNDVTTVSGKVLATMMKSLLSLGADATKFHIVAFGVGAHIAGAAGKLMHPNMIGRITALDPMGLYYDNTGYPRLETADAQLVDVIYTTQNHSSHRDFGHIIFYPEGGYHPQPDCNEKEGEMCSAYRSISYFKRSIITPYAYPAKKIQGEFNGPRPERQNGASTYPYDNYMGEYVDPKNLGKYYVNVKDLPVHTQRHYGTN